MSTTFIFKTIPGVTLTDTELKILLRHKFSQKVKEISVHTIDGVQMGFVLLDYYARNSTLKKKMFNTPLCYIRNNAIECPEDFPIWLNMMKDSSRGLGKIIFKDIKSIEGPMPDDDDTQSEPLAVTDKRKIKEITTNEGETSSKKKKM